MPTEPKQMYEHSNSFVQADALQTKSKSDPSKIGNRAR